MRFSVVGLISQGANIYEKRALKVAPRYKEKARGQGKKFSISKEKTLIGQCQTMAPLFCKCSAAHARIISWAFFLWPLEKALAITDPKGAKFRAPEVLVLFAVSLLFSGQGNLFVTEDSFFLAGFATVIFGAFFSFFFRMAGALKTLPTSLF